MTNFHRFLALLSLVFCLFSLPASGQAQSDDLEFTVAPYVLFGSLTGDAAVFPSQSVPLNLGFGDLVQNLEAGALIHAEVWKGKWGFMGDLIWLRLGADVTLPLSRVVDVEVDEVIVEGFLGHRISRPGRRLDLFAGIRYWDLALDLELEDTPRALDLGDSWVDPVVGGRVLQDLAEEWFLTARADFGGFGIGSDFSWNVQGGVGYDLSEWFSLVAQYKALGVDFANDETGLDFLSYDTVTHGPVIGFVFKF